MVLDDGGVTCGARAGVEAMGTVFCRRHDPAKWLPDDQLCVRVHRSVHGEHRCRIKRLASRHTTVCKFHRSPCMTCGEPSNRDRDEQPRCEKCRDISELRGVWGDDGCQLVIGDGGVTCGRTAVTYTGGVGFCLTHDPSRWPDNDDRCLHEHVHGDLKFRCTVARLQSRYAEVCTDHQAPCTSCGVEHNKLAGRLCKRCGGKASPSYERHNVDASGLAREQCAAPLDEDPDGTVLWCPHSTDAGKEYCRAHAREAGPQCIHVFPISGLRCRAHPPARHWGVWDYCGSHYERRCPGPGEEDDCIYQPAGGAELRVAGQTHCMRCEKEAARRSDLGCLFEVDGGVLCGSKKDSGIAEERRCPRHATADADPLPDDLRCRRVYDSGSRCHRRLRNNGEVCVAHLHTCPADACEAKVPTLDPTTCCRAHRPRCGVESERGLGPCQEAQTLDGGPCRWHAEVAEPCLAWVPDSDSRCTRPATPDGYCGNHHPADPEVRCRADTPTGQCPNQRIARQPHCSGHIRTNGWTSVLQDGTRGPDGRMRATACNGCGRTTASHTRHCTDCAPSRTICRAIALNGPNAGKRCRRRVTDTDYCHLHRPVPSNDARCTATLADGHEVLRCTAVHVDGTACEMHGGVRTMRMCAAHVQDPNAGWGVARPCRTAAVTGSDHCSLHRSLEDLAEEDRCRVVFSNVDSRCAQKHQASRGNGGSTVCPTHRVPCDHPEGCTRRTGDLSRRRCADHAPRCAATIHTGDPCPRAAAMDEDLCMVHLSTEENVHPDDRCTFVHDNGDRCRADTRIGLAARASHRLVYRDLCLSHVLVCGVTSCTTRTGFSDGRCLQHRPPCSHDGCLKAAVAAGDLCERHDRSSASGRCRQRRTNGKDCGHPASGDDTAGLLMCSWHRDGMPSDADRCTHIWEDGIRCPGSRTTIAGHLGLYCAHGPLHPDKPCCSVKVAIWKDGRYRRSVCSYPATVETEADGRICTRHLATLPADEDRCDHTDQQGHRCPRSRLTVDTGFTIDTCFVHRGAAGVCGLPATNGACGSPATVTTPDDGRVCTRHAQTIPADEDRCDHTDPSGRRCPLSRLVVATGEALSICAAHRGAAGPCGLPIGAGVCEWPATVETEADGRICTRHLVTLPAHEDRCDHTNAQGRRCGEAAMYFLNGNRKLPCTNHLERKPCGGRNEDGGRCRRLGRITNWGTVLDRCWQHDLDEEDQCVHVDDDGRCWRPRAHRIEYCTRHKRLAPSCARTRHGRRCMRLALDGRATCDRHRLWSPGMPDDSKEDLALFFFGPLCKPERIERLANRLLAMKDDSVDILRDYGLDAFRDAMFDVRIDPGAADRNAVAPTSHTAAMTDTARSNAVGSAESPTRLISNHAWAHAPRDLRELIVDLTVNDPYDLTGAQSRFAGAVERFGKQGRPLNRSMIDMIRNLGAGLAHDTKSSYASHLRSIYRWMNTALPNGADVTEPFDPEDLHEYFGWLTGRGRLDNGEPLQHGTVQAIRSAVSALCRARRWPDPFEVDEMLAMQISGYGRLYGRVQLRAHAVRVNELARLMRAAIDRPADPYIVARDKAIIATCIGPNAMGHKFAAQIVWEHHVDLPGPEEDRPACIIIPKDPSKPRSKDRIHKVLNLSVAVRPSDFTRDHESVVLCGVQALRNLAAAAIRSGRCEERRGENNKIEVVPVGPVFDKATVGSGMSNTAIRKVAQDAWNTASAGGSIFDDYDAQADWDTRYAMARAVGEPDYYELRDATLILLAWWASLRSKEAAALKWGDITTERKGRGLLIQVRKSKTDPTGTGMFVAVPFHRVTDENGELRSSVIDIGRMLRRYQHAWVRKFGRVPNAEDPVFFGQRGQQLQADGARDAFERLAKAAGLEAELGERLTFHGLRAGFATTALIGGMPAEEVARLQRRATTESLAGYFRLADPFSGTLAAVFDFDEIDVELEELLEVADLGN